jgi:SAM-dependent methyltransferase
LAPALDIHALHLLQDNAHATLRLGQIEAAMADWGSGYVTDKAYVHDFCRVQTPPMLALAALAGGIEVPGAAGEPLAYCDLGCGQGYTANLVAATNPSAQVLGVDFNPSHIANARALAEAAGLENVVFREASFEDLAADPETPQFDIMAMHGIFSWISAKNRQALVAAIARRLKPGGLLYVSYDCMPGWAAVAPLRKIMARHLGPRPGVSSPAAVERAIAYSDALRAAEARFHLLFPNVEAQMERLKKLPRAYLAHELLTRDWEAFSFSDVASELAEAKLVYVGSAYLTDNVDRVNFTEAQQAFIARLEDPLLREDTRDMLLGRQFRRDVFAKGVAATTTARVQAKWLDMRFALTTPDGDFNTTFETAVGKLQLRTDIHGALIDLLRKGPITLREMAEQSPQTISNWQSTRDVIQMLVGRGDLQPALRAEGDAARSAKVQAFNKVLLARALDTAEFGYLASSVTGGGVRVDRLTQLYLLARLKGQADPAEMIEAILVRAAGSPDNEDAPPTAEAARDLAKKQVGRIETDIIPTLKKVGVV